jgi:hypothetical protein
MSLDSIQPVWVQAIAAVISAITTLVSVIAAVRAARSAREAESRNLIVPIAERMLALHEIDTAAPAKAVAKTSLNIFELVGFLCERKVIDEELVERIWGDFIERSCDRIGTCKYPDGSAGVDLLTDHKAAKRLGDRIKKARNKRDSLTDQ